MSSKKTRRARQRVAGPAAQPVRVARPIRAPVREAVPKEVNFAREYHYVVEDLKRIAIFAVGLLALLIVLALIIG